MLFGFSLFLFLIFACVGCAAIEDGVEPSIITFNPDSQYHVLVEQLKDSPADYPPLCLCFFSDLHGNAESLQRILVFADHYSDYIDDVICAGDMQINTFHDDYSFWHSYYADSVLVCMGNHDSADYGEGKYDWECHSRGDAYGKYFNSYIRYWNVVQPYSAAEYGKCYYYKDYERSRIRLIVLDCMSYDEDQKEWLVDTLEDSRRLGLGVVAVSHYKVGESVPVECSFTDYVYIRSGTIPVEASHPSKIYDALGCVDDYIENGGNFICWLTGHNHKDAIGYIPGHHNQLIIANEAATFENNQVACAGSYRNYGTKSQDSFDFISFDSCYRTVKIVKVGNTVDVFSRSKLSLCFNLDEMTLDYCY